MSSLNYADLGKPSTLDELRDIAAKFVLDNIEADGTLFRQHHVVIAVPPTGPAVVLALNVPKGKKGEFAAMLHFLFKQMRITMFAHIVEAWVSADPTTTPRNAADKRDAVTITVADKSAALGKTFIVTKDDRGVTKLEPFAHDLDSRQPGSVVGGRFAKLLAPDFNAYDGGRPFGMTDDLLEKARAMGLDKEREW